MSPIHTTPLANESKTDLPLPVQVIPSDDVAMEFVVPSPPATHWVPFQAMHRPLVENMEVEPDTAVQLIPLLEYAIVLVPDPTATHLVPFHATPLQNVEKIEVPRPVHVFPS